jgi:hypothetical protein
MNLDLLQQLAHCSAHRKPRERLRDFVMKRPEVFPDLLKMAFDVDYKHHFKACWIVEFVADTRLEWFQEHLDLFCNCLPNLKDESGIRPIAKVVMMIGNAHFSKKTNRITLSENQLEKLAEACFDWLISYIKVAAKAYSIRALYVLGKKYDWIHPELKIILEKDYQSHSAAYKAVAREILKKINL